MPEGDLVHTTNLANVRRACEALRAIECDSVIRPKPFRMVLSIVGRWERQLTEAPPLLDVLNSSPSASAHPVTKGATSMHIDAAYPSKYLKTVDLQGRSVRVVIRSFEIEEIGDERKPCLYFQGKDRRLVLNRTNADAIVASYGSETNEWIGKPIELYPDKTRFAGKMVDCIRVRAPEQPAQTDAEEDEKQPIARKQTKRSGA
jgi:hypothetical protein